MADTKLPKNSDIPTGNPFEKMSFEELQKQKIVIQQGIKQSGDVSGDLQKTLNDILSEFKRRENAVKEEADKKEKRDKQTHLSTMGGLQRIIDASKRTLDADKKQKEEQKKGLEKLLKSQSTVARVFGTGLVGIKDTFWETLEGLPAGVGTLISTVREQRKGALETIKEEKEKEKQKAETLQENIEEQEQQLEYQKDALDLLRYNLEIGNAEQKARAKEEYAQAERLQAKLQEVLDKLLKEQQDANTAAEAKAVKLKPMSAALVPVTVEPEEQKNRTEAILKGLKHLQKDMGSKLASLSGSLKTMVIQGRKMLLSSMIQALKVLAIVGIGVAIIAAVMQVVEWVKQGWEWSKTAWEDLKTWFSDSLLSIQNWFGTFFGDIKLLLLKIANKLTFGGMEEEVKAQEKKQEERKFATTESLRKGAEIEQLKEERENILEKTKGNIVPGSMDAKTIAVLENDIKFKEKARQDMITNEKTKQQQAIAVANTTNNTVLQASNIGAGRFNSMGAHQGFSVGAYGR